MAFPNKTPPINATGEYQLRSPFSTAIGAIYRCEAIEGFEKLEEQGVDPFAEYYAPMGISSSSYNDDKAGGINIITLMSEDGNTIYVPSSYILVYPTEATTPYSHMVLAVDLGLLPDWRSLDDLKNYIQQVAENAVGNTVMVTLHKAPVQGFISNAESQQMEAAREASVISTVSHYAGKVGLADEVNVLTNASTALKNIIKNQA